MTIQAEPLLDASQIAANAAAIAAHVGDASIHFTVGSIDHTAILNIGVNTHAQLDTHLALSSVHFPDAPADASSYVRNNNAWVAETVAQFGEYSGPFDASIGTFPVTTNQGDWFNCTVAGTVDGQAFIIGDILVAVIDNPSTVTFAANWSIIPHIGVADHFNLTNIGVNTHAQIDTHVADGTIHYADAPADAQDYVRNNNAWALAGYTTDHTALSNIGVNTHAAIDIHLAASGNPHGVTTQQAYDAGALPDITLAALRPFTLRDAVLPIGYLFVLEDNAGGSLFRVGNTVMDFGNQAQRLFEATQNLNGFGGIRFYPDDFTRTDTSLQPCFEWSSQITSAVPGGGGVGNDGAPNFVNWVGEVIITEQANLFNSQSLFGQGTLITCEGANTGPIYTMINQPQFRTGAAGGSRAGSQQNAVRSQMRIGPNIAGNFNLTSHEAYFATCFVDATVGTANINVVNYFAPKAPSLISGGTIGVLTCFDIPNIPQTNIGNLAGIRSAMASGTFINHTGTAPSVFAGPITLNSANLIVNSYVNGIHMGESAEMIVRYQDTLTDTPGDVWTWQWAGGPKAYWKYWTGFNYWTMGHNEGEQANDAGAGLQLAFDRIAYSKLTAADPSSSNWYVLFAGPNLRKPTVGGEYSDVLWTAGGSLDIDGLTMSSVSAMKINSPAVILNGGTIDDLSNVFVDAMPSFGATRVQALRVRGRARVDGRINLGSESPAQLTANANNFQLGANNNQRTVAKIDSDAARTITGIDSAFGFGQNGDTLKLINVGAFAITLTHQDVLSLAANRIITSTGAAYVLGAGDMVELWYDDTGVDRWYMLSGTGA